MHVVRSEKPFDEVRENLLKALKEKEIKLFAEFDHKANAEAVDMDLPPTTVLVFGNAAVGTHLMQDVQEIALHLPLKITLLGVDAGTELRYESLEDLKTAYDLSEKSQEIIDKMSKLMAGLTDAAI